MNLTEITKILEPVGIAGIVIVLGNLIKITPLQINIWEWLARKIGNALNHDMMDKLNTVLKNQKDIEDRLIEHIEENERETMLRARKSILDFAREIVTGEKHTREQYQECLLYIDMYEKYCVEHPKFPNNRATLAIEMVKDNYQERLERGDFLAEDYRNSKSASKK